MATLARVILQGRVPGALFAAATFLLGLTLPPLGAAFWLVAGVPFVALAWHAGPRASGEVGLLAALIIGLATWSVWGPLGWLIGLWAPMTVGGLVLSRGPYFAWVALGSALVVLVGLGLAMILMGGDPEALVRARTMEAFRHLVDQAQGLEAGQRERVLQELETRVVPVAARFLPGVTAASLLALWWINWLIGLRLAVSVGPAPEIGPVLRAFRMPDATVWLAIGLGALAWLAAGGAAGYWATNALLPVALLFVAQGLAVIHTARLAFGIGTGWLVVFYILFGLFIQLMVAVALLGLADVWADFRSRLQSE